MGRNRKNITIQLNKRIDALLRIGEKKVKVGGRVDGIHGVKTADSYRGTICVCFREAKRLPYMITYNSALCTFHPFSFSRIG